jgi:ATPase subunit of ABC transporter with duplicated ATPase domains
MLKATDLTKAHDGAPLFDALSFTLDDGARAGLVGVNGVGKTTLLRLLAGADRPDRGAVAAGAADRVGYLPQDVLDPRATIDDLLRRALGEVWELRVALDSALARGDLEAYGDAQERFEALGGWTLEARLDEARRRLEIEHLDRATRLGRLSGGEAARCLLAAVTLGEPTVLLRDEPTNHLDADSVIWLREFLKAHRGGLVVISHDTALLEQTVTKVFHLDANRGEIDVYNMGWAAYLLQRETDERRRKRERQNTERKADALMEQAGKMRAKATKAQAAQSMIKRAERMMSGLESERRSDRVARIAFPEPAPCGKTPLTASELSKSYGSLEVFTDVDLAIDKGSRVVILGLNGAGKTTLLRILAGVDRSDTGEVVPGHGLKLGYYAQEHETLDTSRTVLENMRTAAPGLTDTETRSVLGSFLFSGDDVAKPARVLSGGEKTRLALAILVVSSANVLLLDEPTNNLDPASREEVLGAIRGYRGAIVLVTHDEGAVRALDPDRVLILPDGVEDLWNDTYADLVSLA